ncbi:UDP-2,3-diacylglucosamine diphosphatase [Glaciecola petra]|uniref:UDP-2,3-diacylglucosamine hydrolase n=1 Tax=Glaciecola petra TaxID=3075602 RepID=A0ABU2ZPL7_9ALTE|nr:UDP-2,3-diacylglucosamine diphosphatase [Aestuariibacter sp. P117]MDT0594569.1 UDP-2,3-diacylglucosamine diphosphatase [Aestuariibacter sp. P117]
MPHTLFISDLHLSAERPDIAQCFFTFMQNEAPLAESLYILGDLFEYWIGDDDKTPFSESIAQSISRVAETTPVFFIHGNRDFAIRDSFAKRCNMTLLPEQFVIDLYGRRTLLSHGDELCTRDLAYMKFRKKSRGWWWPRLMLALPLKVRKYLAQKGRKVSQNNQLHLTEEIMDVTPSEVVKAMEHHNAELFIHGHTHRPNTHELRINNKEVKRIVLGDWYSQGSVLRACSRKMSLEKREFDSKLD